jgi:hypothetical protein
MATNDLLTLAEAKGAVGYGANDTADDANLARVVTSVSEKLDELIGPTVIRSATDTLDGNGRNVIRTRFYPVSAFASVTEYQGTTAAVLTAQSAGTEPTDAYYPQPYAADPTLYSGRLERWTSGSRSAWWFGGGNVQVVYSPGRVASTALVPRRIKEGAILTLRNAWRPYEVTVGNLEANGGEFAVPRVSFPSFAVPRAVRELLHDLVQPGVGFGGVR